MKPIGGLLSACASAAAAYVDLRREVASILHRAIGATSATQEEIADAVGVKRSTLRRWLADTGHKDAKEQQQAIPFAAVLALPPLAQRVFAERLAESLGCVLADVPTAGEHVEMAAALSSSIGSHADAIQHAIRADADGAITTSERSDVRREIREAQTDLATLDRIFAAAPCTGGAVVSIGEGRRAAR